MFSLESRCLHQAASFLLDGLLGTDVGVLQVEGFEMTLLDRKPSATGITGEDMKYWRCPKRMLRSTLLHFQKRAQHKQAAVSVMKTVFSTYDLEKHGCNNKNASTTTHGFCSFIMLPIVLSCRACCRDVGRRHFFFPKLTKAVLHAAAAGTSSNM